MISVLIFAIAVGFAFLIHRAFSSGISPGPIEDRAEWPEPVLNLLAKASRAQIDVEPVRMYRIVDFTEKYYFWRMRSSPELIELMTREWQLTLGAQVELDRFWQRWPGDWEGGGRQLGQRFLGNYRNPSDNFIVIANESQPVVYGYYYFNF